MNGNGGNGDDVEEAAPDTLPSSRSEHLAKRDEMIRLAIEKATEALEGEQRTATALRYMRADMQRRLEVNERKIDTAIADVRLVRNDLRELRSAINRSHSRIEEAFGVIARDLGKALSDSGEAKRVATRAEIVSETFLDSRGSRPDSMHVHVHNEKRDSTDPPPVELPKPAKRWIKRHSMLVTVFVAIAVVASAAAGAWQSVNHPTVDAPVEH